MDWLTAGFLAVDGITNGLIYALMALALVLAFSVTRVILVPVGELLAFGGLTLAALEYGNAPGTTALLVALGALCLLLEGIDAFRAGRPAAGRGRRLALAALKFLAFPIALHLVVRQLAPVELPILADMALTSLIVIPMGPMLYRIAFEPVAHVNALVLLIIGIAVHFALTGLGLAMFGPEGWGAAPVWDAAFDFLGLPLSGQALVVAGSTLLLILGLYLFFTHSLAGKALRATAVNRRGALLVGIGTAQSGRLAFTLTAAISVLAGMLAVPMTALTYDGGFPIALKGFIAAIIGGLVSYPLAAAGALAVGLLEAFSSFWASSYKEVIVFTLVLPVLLWRSLASRHSAHDDEE